MDSFRNGREQSDTVQTMDMNTQISTFSLPAHIFIGWRKVGSTEGLNTDAEIASFLVQSYINRQHGAQTTTLCMHCNIPLTLFCSRCQLIAQQSQNSEAAVQDKESKPPPSPEENTSSEDTWDEHASDIPKNRSSEDASTAAAYSVLPQGQHRQPTVPRDHRTKQTRNATAEVGPTKKARKKVPGERLRRIRRQKTDVQGDPQPNDQNTENTTAKKSKREKQTERRKPKSNPSCLCYICGASIKQYRLKCHLRTHTGERPYQCGVCGASFSTIQILKRHGSTHTEEKPYTCNICGVSYKELSGIWYHMKRHKGDKPYKCTHCPMTFIKPMPLRIHIRTHTGEHPFECPVCHKKFKSKGRMKKHVERRLKTGETPCLDPSCPPKGYSERHRFACPMCPKKFTTSSHLKQHQERRLKDGKMPCKQL